MSRTQTAGNKPGGVSRALARDRLGVPAVLFFVLAGVAPLTVAAGVIPTAYQTTGLTGHPRGFRGHRGDPGHLLQRVRRDDPAHHQQRRVLRLHRPRPGPSRRGGRRAGGAAVLQLPAGRPVRGVRAERGQRGRRPPACARPVVGMGTGRVGGHHRAGPAAGGHHRPGPRRPAVRGDRGDPGRDRQRAGPPGGRAPQLRHAVPGRADLGRARHLRRAGRGGGARVRRVRAGAGAGRGGPQRPPHRPGGHLPRPRHDRGRVRRGELGHGRPRRAGACRRRGRGTGSRAAVRPRRERGAVAGGAVAVPDLAVRRRAGLPQRRVALHLRARPGERAAAPRSAAPARTTSPRPPPWPRA